MPRSLEAGGEAGSGSWGDVAFLFDARGRPVPLTRRRLRARLAGAGWPYPLNAGRHFLRSALLTRVSGDALQALLGRWHLGVEPWNGSAGLDPLAYRDELAGVLPGLLRDAGLKVLGGPAR